MLTAQSPILITAYGGRNPNTSKAVEALAEFAGIPVYESSPVNNISHEGLCFIGYNPDRQVSSADIGLLVDVDVPWIPCYTQANSSTYWAQIDIDVLKSASPMWNFPSNLRLQGDSARILEMVLERLKAIATQTFREDVAARLEGFKTARAERTAQAAKLAANKGISNAINPHYLFAELGKLLEPTDLIFDEAVTNASPLVMQIPRPVPGNMVRVHGAGIVT